MTGKSFSRNLPLLKQSQWLLGMDSRENAGIFLRGDVLREWSIARSIGRARIETTVQCVQGGPPHVSPDQLVGRGLKPPTVGAPCTSTTYRPINWSGAD